MHRNYPQMVNNKHQNDRPLLMSGYMTVTILYFIFNFESNMVNNELKG